MTSLSFQVLDCLPASDILLASSSSIHLDHQENELGHILQIPLRDPCRHALLQMVQRFDPVKALMLDFSGYSLARNGTIISC